MKRCNSQSSPEFKEAFVCLYQYNTIELMLGDRPGQAVNEHAPSILFSEHKDYKRDLSLSLPC